MNDYVAQVEQSDTTYSTYDTKSAASAFLSRLDEEAETTDEDTSEEEPSTEATSKQEPSESNLEKRYRDLKKHYDTTVHSLRQEIKELRDSKTSQSSTLPQTDEEVEKYKKEHPDGYRMLEKLIMSKYQETEKAFGEKVKELEETQKKLKSENTLTTVKKAHKDATQVMKSQEFRDWLETKPHVKSWFMQDVDKVDASSIIEGLNLFKYQKSQKDPKLEGSLYTDTKTNASFSTKDKLFLESDYVKLIQKKPRYSSDSYQKWKDRISEFEDAERKGTLVLDISKGVRTQR